MGIPSRAQTPAIQYVPVVNTVAGGATTSTICSNAIDTIGDGCVATLSILSGPTTGDSDAAGNIYFPDAGNNVIRRIDVVTGIITVVAGEVGSTALCSGATDTIGDGCLATQAPLSNPRCVRFDRAGNMVIADVTNQVIRSVNKKTGIITLLMGEVGKAARTTVTNTAPLAPNATELDNPYIFLFDPAGNLIVSNSTGDGIFIVFAINGLIDPVNSKVYDLGDSKSAAASSPAADGNGGLATAADFDTPRGLALDAAENVFIGDYNDFQVREITSPGMNGQVTVANLTAGIVNDVAGTTVSGTTGNGGLGTLAETADPQGLGFDNAGTLYIEQYSSPNDFIRILNTSTDIINAYAGTGAATFTGDGGPAAAATFFTPTGLKFNLGNRMTVMDQSNNRIRDIYPTPFFSAVAVGSSATQNAAIQANAAVTPVTAVVSNSEFALGTLSGCTLGTAMASAAYCTLPLTFTPVGPGLRQGQLKMTDSSGNVYADDILGVGLAPAAAFYGAPITTLTGNGTAGSTGNSGPASAALVSAPRGGAFDSIGNFYFADSGNNVIREITKTSGNISIVAGTGTSGSLGMGGAATNAQLSAPTGVAIDAAGNLYIADAGNNRICEVSVATGIITAIAGTGVAGYTGDTGLATAATLKNPSGIAIDNAGTLYIADTGNNVLRAFSPLSGVIVTLAGNGTAGYSGDAGVPQLAELNAPTAVTVDLAGNIYVADTGNAVIRQIVPVSFGIINFQATIDTYAGTFGGTANTGDGGAATAAGLLTPRGLGVDAAGDLYIAAGGQVRMVSSSSGTIITVAGTGASGAYSGEGGSALAAVLPSPADNLAVDQVGNLYLSDTAGNRIVEVAGSTAATIAFGSQTILTSSSPQSVTLYNSGNQPLTLTNIAVPTGFSLSTNSNACASTTVLAAGANCTFTVTFTPPSVANYSSQITITDNALNNVKSTQTIQLTGLGVGHLDPTTTMVTVSPLSPTYGQSVTLTATVSGGSSPTGFVNFVVGTTTQREALQTNGTATDTLTGLAAGTYTVAANYLGDTVNAGSSGSATFTIAPAVLTVTANNVSIYPTQTIPTLTYNITGEVNGDTAATAYSGTPAITTTATSASPVGTYPITISQGTLTSKNYTFVFVPGTLTILSPTFTITLSPTSLIIPSGQDGVVTVTINPTIDYSGTVALSCSSLPADVLCNFTAASVPVNGGAVPMLLTISTNNHPEISSLRSGAPWSTQPNRAARLALTFGFSFLPLALFYRRSTRRSILLRGSLAVLLLLSIQGLSGCTPAAQNAASFSGTVTITGTDTTNLSAKATLSLTIK